MPTLPAGSIRYILMLLAAVVLIAAIVEGVHSCDVRRSKAAQSRVEASQAQAASNSAADAVGTVARSGEAESDKVNPAVRDAGIAALCRRQAYRNDPRCKGARP
jgi:FtsZ-interacting cell division protein ZipA